MKAVCIAITVLGLLNPMGVLVLDANPHLLRVFPKHVRVELSIQPGDILIILIQGNEVIIT